MLKRLRNRFNKDGFATSAFKVGSGNLIGQAIGILTTPILSRIYPDIAYGDQAIITSTATIIINIAVLGLQSAIMKPKEEPESKKVLTTAVCSNTFAATLVVLICFICHGYFKLFEVSGSYAVALILTWLYIVTYNTQANVRAFVNKQGGYNKLFFNPIIGAVANLFVAIPLGLLGFGYEGFIITTIISNTIMIVHMCWKNNPLYKGYRFSDFVYVLKEYKEYVLFQYPANFVGNTATEYPTQFMGRTFSTEALSDYSMCLRILKYPIRLIASPISTVYFRTATEYHREGKNLAQFTYKMISTILLISFIPVAVCCIFAEKIFGFVLGANWASAGTIATILAGQYVMLFCTDCVSYCRVAIGRQKANLAYACIRLVVTIIFATMGYSIFKNLIGTILLLSIGNSLLYVLDMSLNFFYLDKKYLAKYLVISLLYLVIIETGVCLKVFGKII